MSPLATVHREGPVSLGRLAVLEHVSQPMATKLTATLVEQGLVSKTHDPADRRVTRLEITPAGRRRLERSRSRKNAWLAQQLRGLDDGELAALEVAIPVIERLTAESP